MPFAVLHRLRPGFPMGFRMTFRAVTLGVAVLLAGAGIGFAQDAPSYTAIGSNGATPVLLGNNARPQAPSPIASSGPANVQPLTIVTPVATSSGATNKFKALMDNVNSSMTANANAAAAEREKQLASEIQPPIGVNGRDGRSDPNNTNARGSSADGSLIIMHYAEPNDKNAVPSHTFHID
jgi:hypothetical protein